MTRAFALLVRMSENLIEFGNIVGSIFYGVPLGLFLIAFFLRRIGGTAAFWAAVASRRPAPRAARSMSWRRRRSA